MELHIHTTLCNTINDNLDAIEHLIMIVITDIDHIMYIVLQNTSTTLIASTAHACDTRYSFYHVVLVKFYCYVITRSHLQLINTLINTFFSKLRAFLVEQEGRPMIVERKLHGTVDKSSVD